MRSLTLGNAPGANAPDGRCWVDGALCDHRFNYKGCDECDKRTEYRRKHPAMEA